MKEAHLPIGKREDHHLEFKGRDALREKDRLSIVREVVAMLNADGGETWIGVAEREGRAVQVEPISNVEAEGRALKDFLIDVVEPPLGHDEVQVEPVGKVLRITVRPSSSRRPYSLKGKGGAVYFPVRIGDRIRPMTRDEQREAFAGQAEVGDGVAEATRKLLDERAKLQVQEQERLSLRVVPVPEISLVGRQDEILELLRDPELTGNRSSGWVFANPYVAPEKHAGGGVASRWPARPYDSDEWWRTEVRPDGTIHYEAGLERFSNPAARRQQTPKGVSRELWPLAIAELPVSIMRLAATIYGGHLGMDDKVIADLSLFGLRGWKLRPGGPRFLGPRVLWDFPEAAVFEGQDLILADPLVFDWPEVRASPDRCGYRLVAQIYREYGYGAGAISGDIFDPRTGRLLLAS